MLCIGMAGWVGSQCQKGSAPCLPQPPPCPTPLPLRAPAPALLQLKAALQDGRFNLSPTEVEQLAVQVGWGGVGVGGWGGRG